MVRFAQISCKLHEHVGCSSFESSAYFIYLHFHCESLNEPLHLRCGSYLHNFIVFSEILIGPLAKLNCFYTSIKAHAYEYLITALISQW